MALGKLLFGDSGIGAAQAEKNRLQDEAMKKSNQALDLYNYVNLPLQEKLDLAYENPQLVGLLTPEEIEGTALENVQVDPRLREAQLSALESLQNIGAGGLSDQDKFQMQQIQNQANASSQANQAAVLQNLAARGLVGGEGSSARTEALLRAQAGQNAAEQQQMAQLQIAAANEQAKRQALQQAGQTASQMQAQDYQMASNKAQAQDAIARFNAQNRQDVASQNLTAKQQIANAKTDLANRAQAQNAQYNIGLAQQQFQNQMALTGAKAGVLTGQANSLNQQASQVQPVGSQGLFAPLATIAGGVAGGVLSGGSLEGISTGTKVGSNVGGGISNYARNSNNPGYYADGGIVANGTIGNLKEIYATNSETNDMKKLLSMIKFQDGGIAAPNISNKNTSKANNYNTDASLDNFTQLKENNLITKYADGGLTEPQLAMNKPSGFNLGAYNLGNAEVNNTPLAMKNDETIKALSLKLEKPEMLKNNEESPVNLDSIANLAETLSSSINNQQAPIRQQVAFKPSDYSPLNSTIQRYAEGGIIESKVGQFKDRSPEQVQYTPNGYVLNPEAVYDSGMSKQELDYFKKNAQEDLDLILPNKYANGGMVQKFEDGGKGKVVPGHSYVGDRIDAKINSGEMVLNIEQQQRLMDLLKGEKDLKELPKKDIIEKADSEETNLHKKNKELEARLSAIQKLLLQK